MGNDGSHLLTAQPATRHEEEDRQSETDAQDIRFNASEDLIDKHGEDRGVDGDQIGKGDQEKTASRELRLNGEDGERSRDQNGEEKRAEGSCRRHRYE
jgi:hypothetical protein